MVWLDRSRYAAIYGPTVGDEVRLGDTDLWIQIERDLTVVACAMDSRIDLPPPKTASSPPTEIGRAHV